MFLFSPYVKTDILGKIKLKLIVSGFRLQASRAENPPGISVCIKNIASWDSWEASDIVTRRIKWNMPELHSNCTRHNRTRYSGSPADHLRLFRHVTSIFSDQANHHGASGLEIQIWIIRRGWNKEHNIFHTISWQLGYILVFNSLGCYFILVVPQQLWLPNPNDKRYITPSSPGTSDYRDSPSKPEAPRLSLCLLRCPSWNIWKLGSRNS